MRLSRRDLRKIQYDFNSISNRLLQADYQDYLDVLGKFLGFIKNTPIIFEYISDCGCCDWNLEEKVKQVQSSYGRVIFPTGNTEEEEVRNVYAVLEYIVERRIEVHRGLIYGYSASKKSQDLVKGFNDRFVMVLIRHIERYLTKVGIDMGLDEKVVYNVTVQNGQAIIANDNATVTATANIGLNTNDLKTLIEAVRTSASELNAEDKETVSDSLEVIEAEATAEKPKKGMLKTAIAALNNVKDTVKGVAEFGTAVTALIQLVAPLLQ